MNKITRTLMCGGIGLLLSASANAGVLKATNKHVVKPTGHVANVVVVKPVGATLRFLKKVLW
jgi:hypothetical protein